MLVAPLGKVQPISKRQAHLFGKLPQVLPARTNPIQLPHLAGKYTRYGMLSIAAMAYTEIAAPAATIVNGIHTDFNSPDMAGGSRRGHERNVGARGG
jgi:hypothetical protein